MATTDYRFLYRLSGSTLWRPIQDHTHWNAEFPAQRCDSSTPARYRERWSVGLTRKGGRHVVPRFSLTPSQSTARVINGGWQVAADHGSGAIDRREFVQHVIRLAEAGFTSFDCADIYTGVEELLGEFLRGWKACGHPRDEIQIHTKYVPDLDSLATLRRRDVEGAIDRSLRRLGVERLDLVQFYWWDWEVPGALEAATVLADLKEAGKIRSLGVTNIDVAQLQAFLDEGIPLVSNQVQYSLLDQRPENGMVSLCAANGIQLLCYGSLAGGFLSDRYIGQPDPQRPFANRSLTKYRLIIEEAGGWLAYQGLLRILQEIAVRHDVSVANVAARWVLDRPGVGALIVGAKDARRLGENLRLFDLRLDEQDDESISAGISQAAGPAGDIFHLERDTGGPHWAIMKTGLHEAEELG